MSQLLWMAIAWIGGTALILGSLMTLGTLLLFLVPAGAKPTRTNSASTASSQPWQNHLKLLLLSLILALTGLGMLSLFPFPQGNL